MLRSSVALAVLAALLTPSLAAVRPIAHRCTEYVCVCTGSRPSRKAHPEGCHSGGAPQKRDCQMRSGCRHDPAVGTTATSYFAPATAEIQPPLGNRVIGLTEARRPLAGILRIDSPPPERA